MASYVDKTQVKTAITDNTNLDLGHSHITTANWMQLNPIYAKEMVPGESIKCNIETFTRMNPLPVPTFGRGNIKISKFFVPFRTIFRGWNDFITDAYHIASDGTGKNGLISKVPVIRNNDIVAGFTTIGLIVGPNTGSYLATTGSSTEYDFVLNSNVLTYYKFTSTGRQAIKILESLGYKVNWNTNDATEYSALPLLAFAKVYMDYYYPSQYTNTVVYDYISSMFNQDNGSNLTMSPLQLVYLLNMCVYVCYDSDYFVSAFDNPVSPYNGNYSSFVISDISNNSVGHLVVANDGSLVSTPSSSSYLPSNGTPFLGGITGNTSNVAAGVFTQYVDTALHLLTDYMKRHQLAGSRALDRYLARYGKSLSAEKLNRSVYLGTDLVPLQIGDVMSTSDTLSTDASGATLGAPLASFAGKGIGYGKGDFADYSTDEFGMFIVVSSIVPSVGYFQGVDRNVYHIAKTDYWTPEFDSLGNQPITADELYMSTDGSFAGVSGLTLRNQIFGFTPRYAEYKVGRDQVTGSFRIPSLNGNSLNASSSWHLMREFSDSDWSAVSAMTHSPNFCYGIDDASQYNRIFYHTGATAPDQFTMIYNFDVTSSSPMKSLYDTYDWCDADEGRSVTMQTNGVKVN